MENIFFAGVCPTCSAYVMIESEIRESETVFCADCQTRLIAQHVTSRTVLLEEAHKVIPL